MEKRKICWARVLKNISYIIFPVILATLLLLVFYLTYPLEKDAIKAKIDYYDTNTFAENYAMEIFGSLSTVGVLKEDEQLNAYDSYYTHTEKINGNDLVKEINYYTQYNGTNVNWLIIDNDTKKAYTNLEYSIGTSNIEDIITKIMKNKENWKYENGKIETTVSKLSEENIDYIDRGLNSKNINGVESYKQEEKNNKEENNYTIYTSVLDELEYFDNIYTDKILYNTLKIANQNWVFGIPVLVILMIALVPLILNGVGRTSKQEEIALNWYDKILIEFATAIAIGVGLIGCVFISVINGASSIAAFVLAVSILSVGILIIYLACIMLFETIIKRVKTHTFIKTTITYWMYKKIEELIQNIKITKRFILYFVLFGIINLICFGIMWSDGFVGLLLTAIVYVITFNFIIKRLKSYIKIQEAIHSLYNGDTEINLNSSQICKEMKDTAKEIKDIAGGLSNALEEKLKSERLKTELITNVSHDIKTPLTSIINYVDLLKKENIEGEKAQEYLGILDNKSQRLKKLTEDLVEASKASSGAIKLNMEKLNVNELIKQVSGEFEDRFKSHSLQEIITFTENEAYINADSRYMYRVLENMYSNIAKYAMKGTRVYTDILEEKGKISIQIKNVSRQKLNITTDELMQRFVRGDASRNTEGSGLGLSIARSLTELQQGKFNIYLDGDLFKVIIEFEKVK